MNQCQPHVQGNVTLYVAHVTSIVTFCASLITSNNGTNNARVTCRRVDRHLSCDETFRLLTRRQASNITRCDVPSSPFFATWRGVKFPVYFYTGDGTQNSFGSTWRYLKVFYAQLLAEGKDGPTAGARRRRVCLQGGVVIPFPTSWMHLYAVKASIKYFWRYLALTVSTAALRILFPWYFGRHRLSLTLRYYILLILIARYRSCR